MIRRRGFTLIELMVVTAIIGILASVAAPSMMGLLARARRSEVGYVTKGLEVAAKDYYMRNNYAQPPTPPGGPWGEGTWQLNPPIDVSAISSTPGECNLGPPDKWTTDGNRWGYKNLDFTPEGFLRGRYSFQPHRDGAGGNTHFSFYTIALTDLDNDGNCAARQVEHGTVNNGDWVIDNEFIFSLTGAMLDESAW